MGRGIWIFMSERGCWESSRLMERFDGFPSSFVPLPSQGKRGEGQKRTQE